MLRQAKDAGFEARGSWPWTRFHFCAGRLRADRGLTGRGLARVEALQRTEAVCVLCDGRRRYWWCRDRFWWEDDDLSPSDVFALAYERELRARRCAECGSRFELQYDHVIPLALGGASTLANLQVLCAPCNVRKGASI